MTLRQKQKVAVLFTKISTLAPKNVQPPAAGTLLDRATPKAENTSGSTWCIYPANLVSIAPRLSEIWITQYFPIDLNVKIPTPPPQGPRGPITPKLPRSRPWWLLYPEPKFHADRTILRWDILNRTNQKKQKQKSKLNITPNATLYGEIIIIICCRPSDRVKIDRQNIFN